MGWSEVRNSRAENQSHSGPDVKHVSWDEKHDTMALIKRKGGGKMEEGQKKKKKRRTLRISSHLEKKKNLMKREQIEGQSFI